MPCEIPGFKIEPLGEHHLRGAFSCGNDIIDRFTRERAFRDHQEYKLRVQVAVQANDPTVIGFYCLGLKTLAPKSISGFIGRKFGKWPIPSVYLSMVGTDANWTKQGVGTELMFHAFQSTLEIADRAGTACLTLTAVDEEKALWYEGLDLKRMEPDSLEMYIPIATVKAACEEARLKPPAASTPPTCG